jgi:hypothetical protein
MIIECDPDTGHYVGTIPDWPGAPTAGWADLDNVLKNIMAQAFQPVKNGQTGMSAPLFQNNPEVAAQSSQTS